MFVVIAFVIAFVAWLATPYLVGLIVGVDDLAKQGQFGDLFGSINALFSGLALSGVVVALYLQRKEIRNQNIEMAATLDIQAKTVEALVRTMHASSFSKVYDILDDKSVIAARHVVNDLSKVPYEEWRKSPHWKDDEDHIKTLLRAYNIAGIIVRRDFLPESLFVPEWEPSLRSTWNTLAPYVREQRSLRGSDNHWANYEWLAGRAEEWARTQTTSGAKR